MWPVQHPRGVRARRHRAPWTSTEADRCHTSHDWPYLPQTSVKSLIFTQWTLSQQDVCIWVRVVEACAHISSTETVCIFGRAIAGLVFSRQWSLEFLLLCSQQFFWLNSFIRTLLTTGKRLAALRTTLPCVQRCESNEHTSHTSLMEASHHRRWILFTAWKLCGSLYDADNTATCSQTNLQLRFCFSCTCWSIYFSTRRGWAVVFEYA